jgi:putative photosynthetic complex assembly protein 2
VIWLVSSSGSRWAPAFFAVLAVMHTSARINVVLGVRNLNEHFLPRKLAYLGGLFRQRPWNGLLPFSLLGSVVLTVVLVRSASLATGEHAAGLVLLATLAAIGLLEHLLLVMPLPGHLLFEWGLPGRARSDEA